MKQSWRLTETEYSKIYIMFVGDFSHTQNFVLRLSKDRLNVTSQNLQETCIEPVHWLIFQGWKIHENGILADFETEVIKILHGFANNIPNDLPSEKFSPASHQQLKHLFLNASFDRKMVHADGYSLWLVMPSPLGIVFERNISKAVPSSHCSHYQTENWTFNRWFPQSLRRWPFLTFGNTSPKLSMVLPISCCKHLEDHVSPILALTINWRVPYACSANPLLLNMSLYKSIFQSAQWFLNANA